MKHFNLLLILIGSIGFFTNTALGQLPDKAFWQLGSGDGLISDQINCLLQDEQGFIWIGTDEGLYRYDGHELKIYRNSLYDSTSLPSREIAVMTLGKDGKIWCLGGRPGPWWFSFDPENETFSAPQREIDYYQRKDLEPILPKDKKIWQFSPGGPLFNLVSNQYFWEGPDQKIWVSGLGIEPMLFDPKTKSIDTLAIPDPENPGRNLEGTRIFLWKDKVGNQWWYDMEYVFRYNPVTQFCKKYPAPITINHLATFPHRRVLSIDDGSFWIAGGNGLFIYNPTTDSFTRYNKKDYGQNSLSDNTITNIIQDDQGRVWFGTQLGGVNIWDPFRLNASNYQNNPNDPNGLSSNYLTTAYEQDATSLWVAPRSGKLIDFLSFTDGSFQRYKRAAPSAIGWLSNAYRGLVNSLDTTFFFTLNPEKARVSEWDKFDLYFFDKEKDLWKLYENQVLKDQLPKYAFLLPIKASNGDRYYRAAPGGMISNRQNYKVGLVRQLPDGSLKQYLHDPKNPQSSLAFNYINYIIEHSKDSTLWIGTRNGLSHFDPKTETFRSWYPDPNNPNALSSSNVGAMGMLEDTFGNIWMPHTLTGGVTLLPADAISKDSIYFIRFNSSNSGLQSDAMRGIVEDSQSNVWVVNNLGVAKYDRLAKAFRPYTLVPDRNVSPSSISIGKYTGNIYIGTGGHGLFYFNPNSIRPDTIPPHVYLTELYINNQLAPIRGTPGDTLTWETPLDSTISFTKNLNLTYAQNDFSLTFTALNYTYPERTRYKYKLESYDQDWIEARPGNTRATYTNIPHGEYTFRVLACNSEGVWNEEGATLQISIDAPWWATIWAYFSYLLLFGGLVWGIIQWRTHTLKRQRAELRARVNEQTQELKESNDQLRVAKAEAEEANAAKSNFLSFVSHELRTPLTSIIGFANLNKRRLEEKLFPLIPRTDKKVERTMQQVAQNEGIIIQEGQRLADLINNLLDLAKIESGKIEWKMEEVSARDLLARAESTTQGLFTERPELTFIAQAEDNLPTIEGDFNRLLQVIINLISNAVKFTESGTIKLLAGQNTQGHLQFAVQDTGTGIPTEYQETIFERFQQIDDQQEGKPKGTGLGLPICKEIVEYHGGRIWAESEVGKGSTFYFTVPVKNSSLKNQESA